MAENEKAKKNEKQGSVVSNKMAKTIVVVVTRRVPHPLYKRIVTKRKKFYAHDEEGGFAAGERYLPDGMAGPEFYRPVERGLEIRIAEKLRELKRRNQAP